MILHKFFLEILGKNRIISKKVEHFVQLVFALDSLSLFQKDLDQLIL